MAATARPRNSCCSAGWRIVEFATGEEVKRGKSADQPGVVDSNESAKPRNNNTLPIPNRNSG